MEQCFDCLDDWGDEFNDIDSAIGAPTQQTTSDIASIIAAAMSGSRRGTVAQEAVFPVNPIPRQGTQRGSGAGAIRPDVSFVGRDGQRVNLEVDNRRDRSNRHVQDHLVAMREAHAAGLQPAGDTRSVFVETDNAGRIRRIRHVAYTLDARGRVVRDLGRSFTRSYRRQRPSVAQVLQRGLLDRPQQAPAKRQAGLRRGVRSFDAFWGDS